MTYKKAVEILMKRVEEMREFQRIAEETGDERDMALAKAGEWMVDRICIGFRKRGFDPDTVSGVIINSGR